MDKVKSECLYFRLLLHGWFVGFKRIRKGEVSQYSADGVTKWNRDVIFHDDGVHIEDPKKNYSKGEAIKK